MTPVVIFFLVLLAAIATLAGESVAYVHGIDFSQGVAGDSTGVFSPVFVTAPEPSAVGLLALGALGGLAFGWRKQRFLWR